MKAAIKGGRAGAVRPLKKVVRSAAVAAVKAARNAARKSGKHGKHTLRKISMAAAKKAVEKVLADQDALIKKAAAKWTKTAIKKFPPSILLGDMVADSSSAKKQVTQLKEEAKHAAHKEA